MGVQMGEGSSRGQGLELAGLRSWPLVGSLGMDIWYPVCSGHTDPFQFVWNLQRIRESRESKSGQTRSCQQLGKQLAVALSGAGHWGQ